MISQMMRCETSERCVQIKLELRPIIEKSHVGTASYKKTVTKGLKTDASVSCELKSSIEASASTGVGELESKASSELRSAFSISYTSQETEEVNFEVTDANTLYLYQAILTAKTNHGRMLEFGGQLASFPEKQSLLQTVECDAVPDHEQTSGFRHLLTRSGLCLAVAYNKTEAGGKICAYSWMNEAGQRWRFDGDRLVNEHGMYLAVNGNSPKNGTKLCHWTKTEEEGQKWCLMPDGHIRNEHGKMLAVSGNSRRPGADVIQWDKKEEDGQCWHFV